MAWVEVRHPHTHKLLFRYDPARQLVETKQRGAMHIVDLTELVTPTCRVEQSLEEVEVALRNDSTCKRNAS
jgi:hypothetical protein